MTVDYPLDVTNSTRHPPYVSVRGSSSSVQDGRNSHIDLLSQVLRELVRRELRRPPRDLV